MRRRKLCSGELAPGAAEGELGRGLARELHLTHAKLVVVTVGSGGLRSELATAALEGFTARAAAQAWERENAQHLAPFYSAAAAEG